MTRFFLLLTLSAAFWVNAVARAGDDAVYMIGLEVHASKSITPAEEEKISRYLFHNITKWSPGAAMIVYEGDTRGGGSKVDLNVVVYISKLGKAYSLFVENTDEVALRKELMEKGISKADVDTLVGNPSAKSLYDRLNTDFGAKRIFTDVDCWCYRKQSGPKTLRWIFGIAPRKLGEGIFG